MARKTVSAFSVYKEQRLTEHEEDVRTFSIGKLS